MPHSSLIFYSSFETIFKKQGRRKFRWELGKSDREVNNKPIFLDDWLIHHTTTLLKTKVERKYYNKLSPHVSTQMTNLVKYKYIKFHMNSAKFMSEKDVNTKDT